MVCMHFTAAIAIGREQHDDATRYADRCNERQPWRATVSASGEFPMR
jgi:hypothetical protein